MSRIVRSVVALTLAAAIPSAAFAAPPNRQPPPPRQAAPPPRQAAPPPRQAAPPLRQAAPPRQVAQPVRPAPPTQGFNLNHDINARPPVTPPRPPVTQQRPPVTQERPVRSGVAPGGAAGRPAPTLRRAPFTVGSRGPYENRPHGSAIPNPRHWSGNWQWNRGVAWQPAPTYWGGGFWGPFALGALAAAALFGWIQDPQSQVYYPSYQVEPDSPGAQLLQNYGLQQTPCGQDNLVVIWGPDNSVICAYPNASVGPGDYDLDPTTLSLVSDSP